MPVIPSQVPGTVFAAGGPVVMRCRMSEWWSSWQLFLSILGQPHSDSASFSASEIWQI